MLDKIKFSASPQLTEVLGKPAPWIAGVLNITPDSFSDAGEFFSPCSAVLHGRELIKGGCDIIDIGGESTGPGSLPVSAEEEIRRIQPLVRKFAPLAYVSVDTYKAQTAKTCLKLGAQMINDVSALRADSELPYVVRDFNAYVVLMHSKEEGKAVHVSNSEKDYDNLIASITTFLKKRIDFALKCGLSLEKIIVDPGMGRFISSLSDDSWKLLRHLNSIREAIPCPMMVGTSRKSFLGGELKDRELPSQLTALVAYLKGADIIRTHNPKMMREFFDIWNLCGPIRDTCLQ